MRPQFAAVGLLVLMAASLKAQEVDTEHTPGLSAFQVQTFAVKVATPWGNPTSESAVKAAISKRLTAKGWKEADEASADAIVALHGSSQGKQTFREFYQDPTWLGYGWHTVGAPALADSTEYDYKGGALVVDIFDAKTKQAVFRGVSPGLLTGKTANDSEKIDKAVKKMVSSLPSSKGGGEKKSSGSPEPAPPPF